MGSTNSVIRVGPAGWDYRDWHGIAYPKPSKGFDPLAYLAHYFDTIEINSSFYRPPKAEVALAWADRVSENDHFRFTAKLWRRFTHERGTAWTPAEVKETRAALESLQKKNRLGGVLVQFPWSFKWAPENREWLRDVVHAFRDLPLVVEVRHISWDNPEYLAELAEEGVGFVNLDQPLIGRRSLAPSSKATAPIGYVRIHGRNWKNWFRKEANVRERYDYLYSADELQPWADRISELAANPVVREVYAITNNHDAGKAPANALMLHSMLSKKKVEAPPSLFARYEEVLAPYASPTAEEGDLGSLLHSRPSAR